MGLNIRKIDIDDVDVPNPPPADTRGLPVQDYGRRKAQRPVNVYVLAFVVAVAAILGVVLFYVVVRLGGYVGEVNAGYHGQNLDWWLLTGLKVAIAGGLVGWVVLTVAWGLTRVLTGHLVQLQNGQPVALWDILAGWRRPNATQVAMYGLGRFHDEREVWAKHSTMRAMGTYAPTFHGPAPGAAPGLLIDQGPDIGPLAREKWLDWVDGQAHVMVASKTGKGKSTTVKAILRRRIEAGHQVFVIDPHFQTGHWFDLPAVGGGEDWDQVAEAMAVVRAEYDHRMDLYSQGRTSFQRLTVLVDEAFLTKFNFDQWYGQKSPDHPFRKFAAVLGSGARKVGVSVILITQTTLVEDLGLSGSLRENFSRLALDHRTISAMLGEDTDPDRRKALGLALGTQGEFPATAEIDGRVYFLDRTGLDRVEPPRDSRKAAWTGWAWPVDLLELLLEDRDTGGTGRTIPVIGLENDKRNGHSGEPVPPVDPVPPHRVATWEDVAALARDAGLNLESKEALVDFLVSLGMGANDVERLVKGKRSEVLKVVKSSMRV